MNCTCQDWRENIDKINGPIVMQALRRDTKGYEGKPISFCPWCGKKLEEKIEGNYSISEVS